MKSKKGSFTIEAAFLLPLVLGSMCMVILLGISMHEEVRTQIALQEQEKASDMVKEMYRRTLRKELMEDWYEN